MCIFSETVKMELYGSHDRRSTATMLRVISYSQDRVVRARVLTNWLSYSNELLIFKPYNNQTWVLQFVSVLTWSFRQCVDINSYYARISITKLFIWRDMPTSLSVREESAEACYTV
ncbi:unnamed protein product [Parnassius apollo]|uniref:(apollo) hypothetical protein n=1 Tax=Parnassius apollo TaxID=110799 RepID=A0A8S3XB39_PARAO|nr:unnamed protein product [Parnassius apollo]